MTSARPCNQPADSAAEQSARPPAPSLRSLGIDEIVIVDPEYERYRDFVAAARAGEVGLHFCDDARSAVRMARRFRADVWLVRGELADMAGFDLLEMLAAQVVHGDVDPPRSGSKISLDRLGDRPRSAIFLVADDYRLEEEQRALASGIAGYLVGPITIDVLRATRHSAAVSRVVSPVDGSPPARP